MAVYLGFPEASAITTARQWPPDLMLVGPMHKRAFGARLGRDVQARS
jgi:hypothetical protein